MKKIIVIFMMMFLSLTGCSSTLTYYANLGYDLSKVKYSELVFNVYHTDSKDHMWTLLDTFTCSPEEGHYADIRVESEEDTVKVILGDNYSVKEENTESYFSNDIDSLEFKVEGLIKNMPDYQTFEIKNSKEEQFYRLYSVGNENGTFYAEISLNQPYDVENTNLDNILITLTIR